MRNNDPLDGEFRAERTEFLEVIAEESDNFGSLVVVAGLDPKIDFRFKNLDGVDFSDSDLRGYDFTGASLKFAMGRNVIWDHTTILQNADFEGSIFEEISTNDGEAERLSEPGELLALKRRTWQEKIIWLDAIRPGSATFRQDLELAFQLFLTSSDTFVKRQSLAAIARVGNSAGVFKILKSQAGTAGTDVKARAAAFHVLGIISRREKNAVVRFCLELLNTPWSDDAVVFLAQKLEDPIAIRRLALYARRSKSTVLRKRFVGALASSRGQPVALMVRDPRSMETADFDENFDSERLALVANVMVRRLDDELADGRKGVFVEEFKGAHSDRFVRLRVYDWLETLNSFGLGFRLPTRSSVSDYDPRSNGNR